MFVIKNQDGQFWDGIFWVDDMQNATVYMDGETPTVPTGGTRMEVTTDDFA